MSHDIFVDRAPFGRYIILNDCDKPYWRMVAKYYESLDGYAYISQGIPENSYLSEYNGVRSYHGTALEDFGFDIVESEFEVRFKRVRPSVAKYLDGKPREWQGDDEFILPLPRNLKRSSRFK